MTVRPYDPADAPRLCEIFYRSVHEVASARYDAAQCRAWAPEIPDVERWRERLATFFTFVAADDTGSAVGWIAMDDTGYVDMLFCLPEATRRGVAAALYGAVEAIARERRLPKLTAHASLLAQPFFMRQGWRIDEHETVVRDGVEIPRAAMSKQFAPAGD